MKNLQLSLKTKWFEMTKSGVKTEDYREITHYWIRILLISYREIDYVDFQDIVTDLQDPLKRHRNIDEVFKYWELNFKNFGSNIMTLGYPKKEDTKRILRLKHKGIEIRTGNPEWGAEANKLYFVILHGSEAVA